jgi:hypothetical protein
MKAFHLRTVCAALFAALLPVAAGAALSVAQRATLQRYVGALSAGRFEVAFGLLSPDEQRYFGSWSNFESVYAADRVKIDSFEILGSKSDKLGTVALVREKIEFYDLKRRSPGRASANVAYGILRGPRGFVIKDPYHPWRALAPQDVAGAANGVRVELRKISFFTGRLEIVATFSNTGTASVTLLPYGRTVLRDGRGKTFAPIASRLPGLTDKTLYTGLRLAPQAQYTGLMTFLTPDRFKPTRLSLTIAPVLTDGADAPFEVALPDLTVAQ